MSVALLSGLVEEGSIQGEERKGDFLRDSALISTPIPFTIDACPIHSGSNASENDCNPEYSHCAGYVSCCDGRSQ